MAAAADASWEDEREGEFPPFILDKKKDYAKTLLTTFSQFKEVHVSFSMCSDIRSNRGRTCVKNYALKTGGLLTQVNCSENCTFGTLKDCLLTQVVFKRRWP